MQHSIIGKIKTIGWSLNQNQADLPYQERLTQSTLLKEWWQLIQQGTERKVIWIRSDLCSEQNPWESDRF